MIDLILNYPQHVFLNELNSKFRAYVAGYGGGKTYVGCLDLLIFASKYKTRQGYFAPTYPQIRDVFYPTFEEAAQNLGFQTVIKFSDKEIDLYRNGRSYGTIICRSMSQPQSIVGFKIARALIDEIDTMDALKANDSWNKIIARLRLFIDGVVNGAAVTTTPEGFKFTYERFKKSDDKDYSMIQASTYENERFLPPDYIQSLLDTYPEQLIKAYLNGEFVNLTSGSVYYCYNDSCLTREDLKENEPIHVGMDFNVRNMSAIINVKRNENSYAIDELTSVLDTPTMCQYIKERYQNRSILVYPDASGKNTTSKCASESDIKILRDAGFRIVVDSKNPLIKDRVIAVNTAFEKQKLFVNKHKCPVLHDSLTQQIYDRNGMPEKRADSNIDDVNDAFGYYVYHHYQLNKPVISDFKVSFY